MSGMIGHTRVKIGSERSFGLVFCGVFSILAGVAWIYGFTAIYPIVLLGISAFFIVCAYVAPGLLRGPNRLWFRFALFLDSIMSPIVMFLLYAIAFVPFGVFFRLRGKDLLNRQFDDDVDSYWIDRTGAQGSMKRQF